MAPPARFIRSRRLARWWVWVGVGWLYGAPTSAASVGPTPAERQPASELVPESEPQEPMGTPDRPLKLAGVLVMGREQVSMKQVSAILEAEELVKGAVVLWPEDPRIARARDRLVATGYFSRVTLRLQALPGRTDLATLVLDLQERSSLTVTRLYAATSRLTPFHGGISVRERNFLGRSVHLGGGLVWGSQPTEIPRARRQQSARLFVEAPSLGATSVGVVGTFYYISASEPYRVAGFANDPDPTLFRTLDYSRLGGVLGTTIPFSAELKLGVDYRFEQIDAAVPEDQTWVLDGEPQRDVVFQMPDGSSRLTSAEFRLRWDGRELQAGLGQGARFALDIQLSSPIVGSEYEYIKVVGGAAYSFRLPWKHWLTPSLFGGQLSGGAPRFERFHPGDLSAWTPGRELGLVYSTRNPVDVFGTGVDSHGLGNLFASADLEYAISLFRRPATAFFEGGRLFFSAGTFLIAEDSAGRAERAALGLSSMPIGFNANLGLRLDTNFGTLDLSVGNVLTRLPL